MRLQGNERCFRILGVLGRGGFATVYLAQLEDISGPQKWVALKALDRPAPDDQEMRSLFEESWALGWLADRGIVSATAPFRLAGRWCMAMDLVKGSDCRELLRRLGPLPTSVALEIVRDVASTLDNLWHQPTWDGLPAELLHRDVKPDNIRVTSTGDVVLLDFGEARWRHSRFGPVNGPLTATMGYLPPERLDGRELPRGDVFALGVVLEELLTGTPDGGDVPTTDRVAVDALQLALQMRSQEVLARPTAAEVVERANQLLRDQPTTLRAWARAHVAEGAFLEPDGWVGLVVQEEAAPRLRRPSWHRDVAIAVAASVTTAMTGLLFSVLSLPARVPDPATTEPTVVMVAPPEEVPPSAGVALPEPTRQAVISVTPRSTTPKPASPPETEVPTEASLPQLLPSPVEASVAPAASTEPPPEQPPADEPAPPPEEVEPAPATPESTPVPEPVEPEPTPEIAAAEEPGLSSVKLVGSADDVSLVGSSGTFSPGPIPPGTYSVRATFGAEVHDAGTITIPQDQAVKLSCDRRFLRCTLR
ncbi:MAG: protein kinase [Myxococcales bacterium]|nr:protein kinase [Myxococcales bacterium]